MHVTVVVSGSRGDVQPLVALSVGLKAAGHTVRFATQVDFEPFVRRHGLDCFPISGNSSRFFSGRASIVLRERMRKPREFQVWAEQHLLASNDAYLADAWRAAQGTDLLLYWPWVPIGPSIQEKLGIPCIVATPNPVALFPTWAFPNPFHAPPWRLGPIYNRLSWMLAEPAHAFAADSIAQWRKEALGLPALPHPEHVRRLRATTHVFGYSPTVLPKPRDWHAGLHVTGYWFLDEATRYEPPAVLTEFLGAGPPPVVVGFGSMVSREPKELTKSVIRALELSGQRGILVAGWGGLKPAELPPTILAMKEVPYDWLLPHAAAMVHHGGSGATSAALRFGVPNLAVTFGFDQTLWGRRLRDLGVGLDPLPIEQVTAERLGAAIGRVARDKRMRERAKQVAEAIRGEDGVGNAVRIIERIVERGAGEAARKSA